MSIRRIVVTGSESTGKTTLARDLAAHFGVLWVPEAARQYASQRNWPLTAEDVSPIASAQIAAEDAALVEATRRGDALLFFDTDLVSTVVYSRQYYGDCPAWIDAEARARLANLYLFASIDLPWVADGIRDREEARVDMDHLFLWTLDEFDAAVCEVRGLGHGRFECALGCIEAAGKQ